MPMNVHLSAIFGIVPEQKMPPQPSAGMLEKPLFLLVFVLGTICAV